MSPWFVVLILSVAPAAPIEAAREAEAHEVFRCDFTEEADRNFDGWPDGWSRRRGPGYPLFLPIEIVNAAAAGATPHPALRIKLDGGSAAVFSPPIPVSSLFSYRATGLLKTEELRHDVAYYSLIFFDADGRVLETYESPHRQKLDHFTPVEIGPVTPTHSDTHVAVIGLHLRPRDGGPSDLRGAALFDDVRLARLPRVQLRTNHKLNLFASLQDVEIECDVSGVLTSEPLVRFSLDDVNGQTIATHETRLSAKRTNSNHAQTSRLLAHDGADSKNATAAQDGDLAQVRGFAGRATWKPTLPDYGFYRVRVSLADTKAGQIERTTTLAVARPLTPMQDGEFGWSLPAGDTQLSLPDLVSVVTQVGIHWLKFPTWFGDEDPTRADRLAWFADRIDVQRVKMVGMLDQPPPALRKTFGEAAQIPIGMVFVEAPLWQPAVDPVMARLSLKVRYWQLGSDGDNSFVGFQQLAQKIGEIKQYFLKYGQEVQVGMAWPWLSETPSGPWDFLSRNAAPDLTAAEIASYLTSSSNAKVTRWIMLQPLSRQRYDLPTRARDLVERMLAAKIHRADAIFLPDPFDAQHGLLHADGSPNELLLPWRTTATLLGGAEYLGSIQLPSGSTNHLFQRGQEVVMMVWNRHPVEETLYLGEAIVHFDLWGRRIPHASTTGQAAVEQTISVGALPTFVTGLSLPIAQWRVGFAVEQRNLPSIFGSDQTVRYSFKNAFAQGVGGDVRIHTPADWELGTPPTIFRAAAGEEVRERFEVRFKSDAQSGPQTIRLDFRVTADRDYAFSVYQQLHVGIGDVSIQTMTRLNDEGELIVEQTFTNQTDDFVSFNCLLFAPGRRRERVQVLNLGRGRHTASFVLPRGQELLGETLLLRAEELNGDRILNYRILPQQ